MNGALGALLGEQATLTNLTSMAKQAFLVDARLLFFSELLCGHVSNIARK